MCLQMKAAAGWRTISYGNACRVMVHRAFVFNPFTSSNNVAARCRTGPGTIPHAKRERNSVRYGQWRIQPWAANEPETYRYDDEIRTGAREIRVYNRHTSNSIHACKTRQRVITTRRTRFRSAVAQSNRCLCVRHVNLREKRTSLIARVGRALKGSTSRVFYFSTQRLRAPVRDGW